MAVALMVPLTKRIYRRVLKLFFTRQPYQKLLDDNEHALDPEFFESLKSLDYRFYKKKVVTIKLGDMSVLLLGNDGFNSSPLDQSPAFKFLQGEKAVYRAYCQFKSSRLAGTAGDIAHSVERFEQLVEKLEKGYDENYVIVVNWKNEILDGQHRACFLLHKYGAQHKVPVLQIWT